MLKKKYYTTPLIKDENREPIVLRSTQKPNRIRNVRLLQRAVTLGIRITWLGVIKKIDDVKKAEMIRTMLEDFGGLWIKVGQLVSMRTDLFSKQFCDAMAKLQDRAFGFPEDEAETIIREEMGGSINEVFSIFDPKPIAAASIAQVHKAKLRKEGEWVAIKVQKPHSDKLLELDMKLFKGLFGFLGIFGLTKDLKLDEMIWELNQMMVEELDFRYEASHMQRMRKTLKKHKIYVPKRFRNYCTKKVIVMEWLHGITMSEFIKVQRKDPRKAMIWSKENKIEPVKLGRRLIQSHLRQMFEDNFYHGDLHPGNIMILKNNKLALIDFGNVGSFDSELLALYKQYIIAQASGQFNKSVDLLFLMFSETPPIDLRDLRAKLARHMRSQDIKSSVKELPFHEKSLTGGSSEIDRIFFEARIGVEWSMLQIGRAMGALDLTLPFLDPEMSYNKTFIKYGKDSRKRQSKQQLGKILNLVQTVENTAAYIIPNLRRDGIKIGAALSKAQLTIYFLFRAASFAIWGLLAFFVWTYVYQHHNNWISHFHQNEDWLTGIVESFPILSGFSWIIAFVLVLMSLRSISKFKTNFRQLEAIHIRN